MSIYDPDLGPRTLATPVPAPFPACLCCGQPPDLTPRQDGTMLVWHACGGKASGVNGDDEAQALELWLMERLKFWVRA